MGLLELFVAGLISGLSALNAVVPWAAWSRTRDPRLWFVSGASLCLLVLGLLWAWGQVPGGPSAFAQPSWPALLLVLATALLLLGTALWPRRA